MGEKFGRKFGRIAFDYRHVIKELSDRPALAGVCQHPNPKSRFFQKNSWNQQLQQKTQRFPR
jgi:hypothetical protein